MGSFVLRVLTTAQLTMIILIFMLKFKKKEEICSFQSKTINSVVEMR